MKKILKIPFLMVFFLLALFTLLKTDPTWAASAPAPARQTILPLYYLYLPLVEKNYVAPAPLWRFGVAQARRNLTTYDANDIVPMRFGWYVDFSVNPNPPATYGMEYVPTIRIKQTKVAADGSDTNCRVGPYYKTPYAYTVSPSISQIQAIASSHPGMTWLVGNEMELVDNSTSDGGCGGQDEILPELYAQAYYDIYTALKSADPAAQVALGGMAGFTDLRSQYLDRAWAEYLRLYDQPMPVDVWNIHLYVIQEVKNGFGTGIPAGLSATSGASYTILDNKDFTKAWDQIILLRTWMKNHGQQTKPLIISEYGTNMPAWIECPAYPNTSGCPFTPDQVRDSMMYPSFDAFLNQTNAVIGYPADGNRLVQRWLWWSADYDDGSCDAGVFYEYFNGSLFNSGLGPTFPPTDCSFPSQGMTTLGMYWRDYVKNLPIGSARPYTP